MIYAYMPIWTMSEPITTFIVFWSAYTGDLTACRKQVERVWN